VTVPTLDDYAGIVGAPAIEELRLFARRLAGRRVKMINSTAVGGGVAEVLVRLVPLLEELGVRTTWDVIKGGEDFFQVTKAFHNALHGGSFDRGPEAFATFLETNRANAAQMTFDEDFVVVHDPQPVALVEARGRERGNHWIWRCHIDLSHPHPGVWEFLRPCIERYDAAIFSSPAFCQRLRVPQYLFYPSIDPLADKNKDLPPEFVDAVFARLGVPRDKPIVTQISRFDRLKDPVGVIRAFKIARRYIDCRLVLAGGGATDDPEGAAVLEEARAEAGDHPDVHILVLPPTANLEINALVRGSTIVLQKSLKEGFGLTVAEALWKRKPVIAGAVGGIPAQVIHNVTGILVHSVEGCAYQIRSLLTDPERMRVLGEYGHQRVKQEFLITSNLRRWLVLMLLLLAGHPEADVVEV
jgi:trehalose synthase